MQPQGIGFQGMFVVVHQTVCSYNFNARLTTVNKSKNLVYSLCYRERSAQHIVALAFPSSTETWIFRFVDSCPTGIEILIHDIQPVHAGKNVW